jgi:hypothetical protein
MSTLSLIPICVFLAVSGCDKSAGPLNIIDYPMGAGTAWSYHWTLTTYNYRPVLPGATVRDTVIEEDMTVEILGNAVLRDSLSTIKFRGTSTAIGGADISYYTLGNSTLSLAAYQSGGATDIFPKGSVRYRCQGQSFSSIRGLARFVERTMLNGSGLLSDSITYETQPPKVLMFPLAAGKEWAYRAYGNPGPKMNKRVLSQENLVTPAGTFPTFKIQLLYDWNNLGVWDTTMLFYDHVGLQGLMKRTLVVLNIAVSSESGPGLIGYIDMKIEHDLTSLKIQ